MNTFAILTWIERLAWAAPVLGLGLWLGHRSEKTKRAFFVSLAAVFVLGMLPSLAVRNAAMPGWLHPILEIIFWSRADLFLWPLAAAIGWLAVALGLKQFSPEEQLTRRSYATGIAGFLLVIAFGVCIEPVVHLLRVPQFPMRDPALVAGLYAIVFFVPALWLGLWQWLRTPQRKARFRNAFVASFTVLIVPAVFAANEQITGDFVHRSFLSGMFAIYFLVPFGVALALVASAVAFCLPE